MFCSHQFKLYLNSRTLNFVAGVVILLDMHNYPCHLPATLFIYSVGIMAQRAAMSICCVFICLSYKVEFDKTTSVLLLISCESRPYMPCCPYCQGQEAWWVVASSRSSYTSGWLDGLLAWHGGLGEGATAGWHGGLGGGAQLGGAMAIPGKECVSVSLSQCISVSLCHCVTVSLCQCLDEGLT